MLLFAYISSNSLTSEFVFPDFSPLSYRTIFSSPFQIISIKYLPVFNSSFLHWYIHQISVEHLLGVEHLQGVEHLVPGTRLDMMHIWSYNLSSKFASSSWFHIWAKANQTRLSFSFYCLVLPNDVWFYLWNEF